MFICRMIGWFSIDVVSCLPVNYIAYFTNESSGEATAGN
eukprot:SAG11_NODE_33978_length_274_cov_0.885714_2_plen_38_part_01